VKNAKGQPIHAGTVVDNKDPLFVLDTTNPGLRSICERLISTLVNEWGVHYIKMDFMDDSGIGSYYYKPNTTALEAQRIGLKIIRDTVGTMLFLDKDGSVHAEPRRLCGLWRISQDTGTPIRREQRSGTRNCSAIYMNRKFFRGRSGCVYRVNANHCRSDHGTESTSQLLG